ncbi:MAG TPA: hypothetical protein PK289_05205 [Bacteroidia bacterium]|nr:hypothetical protein [Bacteroidia bacterium]
MKKNFSLILALIVISLKGFAGFNATIYGRATQCPDATNAPTMFNEYTSSKNFDASSGLTQEKIVYTCGGLVRLQKPVLQSIRLFTRLTLTSRALMWVVKNAMYVFLHPVYHGYR